MSVDTEYISSGDFNAKFKNYLRDFYVYQFKNKNIDFYDTGSFSRARMVAVVITCASTKRIRIEDFYAVKMKDITMCDDGSVSISIRKENKNGDEEELPILIKKPLCEMFKYLYSANESAYFITGNTAVISSAGKEKLEREEVLFKKECASPRTEEKMYHYWGRIYLEEANETITTGTYRNDSIRIQTLIEHMANVKWSNGRMIDHLSDSLVEDTDSCVECVTADTRELNVNPFHTLYRHCNRYNNADNDFYNVVFALLLYFNVGERIRYQNKEPILSTRLGDLNLALKEQAAYLFNISNNRSDADRRDLPLKMWNNKCDDLTKNQKNKYAQKAIEKYINDSFERFKEKVCDRYSSKHTSTYSWEGIKNSDSTIVSEVIEILRNNYTNYLDLFVHMIMNKKRIIFNGENFEIVNCDLVEKQFLYIAIKRYLRCGEKQFTNIVREIVKSGILIEYKKIVLYCNRSERGNYNRSRIESIIRKYPNHIIELFNYVDDCVYSICYDNSIDKKTLDELKEDLESVCEKYEESEAIYFGMQKCNLNDILGDDSDLIARFSNMISFFSQTEMLGEVGDYILDRLPVPTWKMFYKHNYIVRALNDYNNIDLLYAMQNPKPDDHYWIEIECRDALNKYGYQHFICYPIEIRENVSDGKQYLIYYHPQYRSISSVRIDFIDNITIGKRSKDFHFYKDIERAHILIKYTWGIQYGEFYEGNVKADPHPSKVSFVIQYDTLDEKFIKDRIKREVGSYSETKKDDKFSLLEVSVEVVNPWDMLYWIRSYTRRVSNVSINYSSYMNDVERANNMYLIPTPERVSVALNDGDNRLLHSNDIKFKHVDSFHERLFNEIYCDTFKELGRVLHKTITQTSLNREIQFDSVINKFFFIDNNLSQSNFSFIEGISLTSFFDLIPLTEIEIQWLRNILDHKLAKAFLTKDEIGCIKKQLPHVSLFDVKNVILLDQHSDNALEEYYKNDDFGLIIREIMSAILERRVVRIQYKSQYDNVTPRYEFVPYCIEYSKRDNRFRVKAVCRTQDGQSFFRVRTFVVDGIISVEKTRETVDQKVIQKRVDKYNDQKKKITIYFTESNGVPDRILTEFSCYEKECIRWGSGRYRMTLNYYYEDHKEIIIRLLKYGSLVTVWGDDDDIVVKELKDRYREQIELFKEREITEKSKEIDD